MATASLESANSDPWASADQHERGIRSDLANSTRRLATESGDDEMSENPPPPPETSKKKWLKGNLQPTHLGANGIRIPREDTLDADLQAIANYLSEKAREASAWYQRAKARKKSISLPIRWGAVGLFAASGFVPIVDSAFPGGIELGKLGYVTAALAASLLGLDRYSGLTSGWVRYVTTDLRIQRALADFQMDWVIANSCLHDDPEEVRCGQKRLVLLKQFNQKIADLVATETLEWATEFQNALSALERATGERRDAEQPGLIHVKVERGASVVGDVEITLDGHPRERIQRGSVLLRSVPPGTHEIAAVAVDQNGDPCSAVETVNLAAGATVKVTLQLE